MNYLKLPFVAGVLASTLLACSAAPSSDDVDVDIESDTVDTQCMKGSICHPPLSSGDSRFNVVLGGGNFFAQVEGPARGPDFICGGAGPEGDGAEYRVLGPSSNKQCWSSRPAVVEGGIPWGFALLSLYICPAAYPVNRCDPYGRCTCWSY